jgi:hypothetical protein
MPTAGRNPLNRLDERLFPTVDVLERPAAGLRGGAGRTRTSNQTVIAETFGKEFAEPFLAHNDDVRGRPCTKLCRNGVGSIALRGEVLCRNCNPAALLKNRNELVIGSGKTDGSDHIEH